MQNDCANLICESTVTPDRPDQVPGQPCAGSREGDAGKSRQRRLPDRGKQQQQGKYMQA
jgi:hypothetical protein